MNGERATLFVTAKLHLGSVVAGFTINEIADFSVFYDHFGPERIARKTEKIRTFVGSNLDDDVSPTSEDVFGIGDVIVWEGLSNDSIEGVFSSKIITHISIITWKCFAKAYGPQKDVSVL